MLQAIKRQHLFWNESIDKSFIDAVINKLDFLPENTELIIYLNSTGGMVAAEKVLIDLINANKSRIQLIVTGTISSAAFTLFYLSKCYRKIIPGIVGMYHGSSMELGINTLGQPSDQNSVAWKRMLLTDDKYDSEYICDYLEFTPAQKRKVMQGKDVYFNTEEMQKFLEISNTKNNEDQFRKNTK